MTIEDFKVMFVTLTNSGHTTSEAFNLIETFEQEEKLRDKTNHYHAKQMPDPFDMNQALASRQAHVEKLMHQQQALAYQQEQNAYHQQAQQNYQNPYGGLIGIGGLF